MKKLSQRTDVHRAGFTLLEMLVVIGITTLLSVVAIGYSKAGQNEVALTVETSKIAEVVLQAKELAINTYGTTANGSKACAFGVHFDANAQTYSLFAFITVGAHCPSLASTTVTTFVYSDPSMVQEYQPSSWNIPVTQGVQIDSTDFSDVLFYPPAPITLINPLNAVKFSSPSGASNINLSTIDDKNHSVISISPEGQVTF